VRLIAVVHRLEETLFHERVNLLGPDFEERRGSHPVDDFVRFDVQFATAGLRAAKTVSGSSYKREVASEVAGHPRERPAGQGPQDAARVPALATRAPRPEVAQRDCAVPDGVNSGDRRARRSVIVP
jgi:hypothetical protein